MEHGSLTNIVSRLHHKTILVCHFVDEHYSILLLQLDQHQTSINQPAVFFGTCAGGRFLSGYCQQQSYLQTESCLAHTECSNSYGNNLPVLEQCAHAELIYLDWTWHYSNMRQRELAGILYLCDLHTRKTNVHTNKLKNKRKKEKLLIIQLFWDNIS